MTTLEAILLGAIQGVTEFLPVSSSGHLVLSERLFGLQRADVVVEVALHLGTLGSIFVIFWKDIAAVLGAWKDSANRMIIGNLILATLPAGVAGLLLKDQVEAVFHSTTLLGFGFLITAAVLYWGSRASQSKSVLTPTRALVIGLAQMVAILPGISRSGMTISAALLLGLSPREAARFSFFLSIPIVLGTVLLVGVETAVSGVQGIAPKDLSLGVITAFGVGIVSLKILLKTLARGRFSWFALYCVAASIATFSLGNG